MSNTSNYVVTGASPEVLDCLDNPATMGVVWRGAFLPEAMTAARRAIPIVREQPRADTMSADRLHNVLDEAPEAKDFVENIKLLKRFLGRFGRSESDYNDISRVEFYGTIQGASNGFWHVDPERIVALGVPVGATSEYVPQPLPGWFDGSGNFTPEDGAEAADRIKLVLPNDALLVMKGKAFQPGLPEGQASGLPHRRANELIELSRADRMVFHRWM